MNIKHKNIRNKYKMGIKGTIALMIGALLLSILLLSQVIIKQNISIIGMVAGSLEQGELNNLISQMMSKTDMNSYQLGCQVLQETGYQNNTYLLFLQPFIRTYIMSIIIVLVLIGLYLLLRRKQRQQRIQEIHSMIDWINSEETALPKYCEMGNVPIEVLQAIEELKIKDARNAIIYEENTAGMMKYMENISHQLKTPLTVVRTTCERVSMKHQEVEDKMTICQEQADKMSMLIRDFLQLGRFDCNKQKMKFEYIRATDLIETVANELDVVAQKKNITIVKQGKEDISWYCDIFWMEEILGNVLKNCMEHSENGEIYINYEFTNHVNQIRIRDCGVGLKEGIEKQIFERYSSVNRINIEGSGLGLSIAQEAIKMHFGTITARNHTQGGVEFRISFPQLDPENIY